MTVTLDVTEAIEAAEAADLLKPLRLVRLITNSPCQHAKLEHWNKTADFTYQKGLLVAAASCDLGGRI